MKKALIKELLPLSGLLLGLVTVATSWTSLPATIPIHFGLSGRPDGFAPKMMLILLPSVAIFLYSMLAIGQAYGKPNVPWKLTNVNRDLIYDLTKSLLYWLRTETAWLLGYLQWALVQTAFGKMDGLGVWFAPVFICCISGSLAVFFARGTAIAAATK